MRPGHLIIGAALTILSGCALVPEEPREPTVEARLLVMQAVRDARTACARGLGRSREDCVERSVEAAMHQVERRGRIRLFATPAETEETRERTVAAFQAAVADCRARGIMPRSTRWEHCNVERAIVRLGEAAR